MAGIVAITGATGFIGRVLLRNLVAAGWKVHALTRKTENMSDPAIQWFYGDLDNHAILYNLVSGADAVIHCAGAVRGNCWEDFYCVNVAGTENLLHAVSRTGFCPRFLYLSSLAAREPSLSWYARSKYEAEQLVQQFVDQVSYTIYRPAAVYGPGDKELKPLFKAMRYGILPALGASENRFGLLYVDDLVTAIYHWLELKYPTENSYEIDDGTIGGYSFASIAAIAQHALNRPVRCLFIPPKLILLIAHLNLRFSRLLNYAPMLTPKKVTELRHSDWTCDISPLQQALNNWQPATKLDAVLLQLMDR